MICFNENLINELVDVIPKRIMELDLQFNKTISGLVRYDYGKLNAIYLDVKALNFEPMAYDDKSTLVKFDVTDGYEFNSIYKVPEDNEVEYRYDSELNLISKYEHNEFEDETDENYELCSKIVDDVKVSYIAYKGFKEGKEFPELVDDLINRDILSCDRKFEFPFFWKKDDENIIYLNLQ